MLWVGRLTLTQSGFSIRPFLCFKGRIRGSRRTERNSGFKSFCLSFTSYVSMALSSNALIHQSLLMSLKKTRPRENGRALMCCISYESRGNEEIRKKVVKGLRTFDKNYHMSLKDGEGHCLPEGQVRNQNSNSTPLQPSDNTFNSSLVPFFTSGPPGSPGGVRLINKTDKSVTLQWSRGADNHSPISKYTVQYRDSFSKDVWKNATTCEHFILVGQINTVTLILSWLCRYNNLGHAT